MVVGAAGAEQLTKVPSYTEEDCEFRVSGIIGFRIWGFRDFRGLGLRFWYHRLSGFGFRAGQVAEGASRDMLLLP